MVRMRRRCPVADLQCLGARINFDLKICLPRLSIFSNSFFHWCCINQLVSLHGITDGQCHWWDQTLVRKIVMPGRRRVGRAPGGKQPTGTRLSPSKPTPSSSSSSPSPWIQGPSAPGRFRSHRLLLLQVAISCQMLDLSLLLVRGACTIPSTSFAMTSNILCKSLNSCATKILTFFLSEASSGKIDVFLLSKDNFL